MKNKKKQEPKSIHTIVVSGEVVYHKYVPSSSHLKKIKAIFLRVIKHFC